ncbi:MAG: beta-glucosidase BglX [Phycisphaerae bacterium]|nr:beta-glucosidase BglX [Phycisphaerae bacterium]
MGCPSLVALLCVWGQVVAAGQQDVEQRVEALLRRMTPPEKIGQMVQINALGGRITDDLRQRLRQGRIGSMLNETDPNTSLEIQRIATAESRLGIPVIMGRDVIHGFRTIFPIPLGQAAAWDPDLVRACAEVAAAEAAAAGYHWTFAPMMDICRDPRWGRIAEGFGEDPYLASVLAAAMVRGLQGDDLASPHTIAACAKHFAGYGAAEGGRDYDTAWLPEGLLRDVILPPFKAAVEAGVATVMCSFNEINGVPSSGNAFLLRQILREEWGFKGFVVSDWDSMSEMLNHGFCKDLKDVALKSIQAGVDMEMQSTAYLDHLEALVKEGSVPERLVDEAVRNILRIKFRLGLFDRPSPYSARRPDPPSAKALDLARRSALQSTVLLKNQEQCLPLSRDVGRVAVIGPMANDPYEVLGTWNRDGRTADTVTPLAAIRTLLGDANRVLYAQGLAYSRGRDKAGFAQAVAQARRADAVLVFVGEEAILSGEAHSRARLDLPGTQNDLIADLAATGKPLVLVVMAGRPLILGPIADRARAVLFAWHPGTMGGPALADLLFGVRSPSGKLPVTCPQAEGQIPIYYSHKNTGRPPAARRLLHMDEIPVRARQSSAGDAARYLDIGYLPQYPFGYGLSYTEFRYSNLRLSSHRVTLSGRLKVSADLHNAGPVEGEEVVQLYVRDLVGSLTRPVKELKGFQRVRLKPNQTKTVTFDLPIQSLGFHNVHMEYKVEPGLFHLWVAGDSHSPGVESEFEVIDGRDQP